VLLLLKATTIWIYRANQMKLGAIY